MSGPMFEVEKITNHDGETNEYFVHWKDGSKPRWVPYHLCDCPTAIFEFEKSKGFWNDAYEIDGIVDSIKNAAGETEYLVKWTESDKDVIGKDEFSWVKESDFIQDPNTRNDIAEFQKDKNHFDYLLPDKRKIKDIRAIKRVHPYPRYAVNYENQPAIPTFSVDSLYVMPNGRKAIRQYYTKHFPHHKYREI